MKHKTRYGEISKIEAQEDGTLQVWGVASSESEDSDGETITATAMKAALPDYMRFGAVREMHQPKAAGTALAVEVGDDGVTKICAHIVDSEAIRKVNAGVYKGFSIGGRVTARDELKKTIITGLRLTEISLVDRPANPDAVITCYKADGIEPADDKETTSTAADEAQKAGRRNNARDQATLNQIFTLLKSLGAAGDDDPDTADKLATPDPAPLAKLAAELDVAKSSLRQMQDERDNLKQQLAKLAAEPAPSPAVLKAIAKGDDLGEAAPTVSPVQNGDGSVNDAASLIKMIHAGKAA